MIRPGVLVSAAVSLLLVLVGVWLVVAPRFGGGPVGRGHLWTDIDVSDDARDEFIQKIKMFGASNGFKVQVRSTHPDGRHFNVTMFRTDVQIAVMNNPFDDGRQFHVMVWQEDDEPARMRAEAFLGALKESVGALHGVTPHVRKSP